MEELTITYSQANENWLNPNFGNNNHVTNENFDNLDKCTSKLFVIENDCEDNSVQYYQFCYNANEGYEDVYAYEIDENGEPKNLQVDKTVQICRIFSDYTFNDGEELKVNIDGDKILINSLENEGLLSEIGASTGELKLLESAEAIEGSDTDNENETQITEAAAVTEAVSEIYSTEDTVNAVAEVQLTSIPVVSQNNENSSTNTLLAVFLIIAVIIALIFGGGAVYFFMQMKKQKTELSELKKQCDELKKKSTEYNKKKKDVKAAESEQIQELQKEISQKEEKIRELNNKIENAKNIATMAKENKDENDKLKIQLAKKENDVTEKDKEIEKLKEELYTEKAKIAELENQLKQSQKAKETVTVKEDEKSSKTQKESIGTIARKISIDTKIADEWMAKDSDSKFLNINSSLTGDITLSESGSYRTAPLICIQNNIFLNPYYYSELINNRETYEKIVSVKNVFKIEELSNMKKTASYGLESIYPATVEKIKNNYQIKKMGKITVK